MQIAMKQKVLLVITVAAFGYLGCQVYALMKEDMKSTPSLSTTHSHHLYVSDNNGSDSNGFVAAANAAEPPTHLHQKVATATPMQVKRAPLAAGQKAYLDMVNQYELAKMKRRLLEERAAIAAAQHRIATLSQQTREIDAHLVAGSGGIYDDTSKVTSNHSYELSYVDRQNGDWSATLNKEGRYYQVHKGSKLHDGSEVENIDHSGVIIRTANQRERITFDGMVALPQVSKKRDKGNKSDKSEKKATPSLVTSTLRQPLVVNVGNKNAANKNKVVNIENVILHSRIRKKTEKKPHDIVLAKQKQQTKPEPQTKLKPAAAEQSPVKASVSVAQSKAKHVAVPTTLKEKTAATVATMAAVSSDPAKKTPKPVKPSKVEAVLALNSDTPPSHLSTRYTEDERRILAMPKTSYTIQLIGSYHRDIVENFAIANDLGNRAMQFYVMNRGKRWYVLLYGNYLTRKAAQKALKDLPPNLTPEDPWVRPTAIVQQDIRKHKRGKKTSLIVTT